MWRGMIAREKTLKRAALGTWEKLGGETWEVPRKRVGRTTSNIK
ncbi:Hypothetical protein CpCap5W_1061 [Corynebacterium pseudotuberculosis]|nr:Hypothetical protein Cp3995_1648 [Corynebacterium pseudotuberculosis 3/99-5]AFH52557.1 Hypothetical protein Cp267_1672 [Corynebacterium pseudotuberculosis 267]AIG08031.1 hypothetical protein CPTA_02202 [Corynebacterium pseudotuberculosis]AIG09609.1 hypothetical protein CPTB_01553 [Corynebacterium pseudotuberculosis]AIG12490.1 hypothetical protein CPTC_02202 [Corynebacterium pseudotuberculosis]